MRRRAGRGSAYKGPFLISGAQVGIISIVILVTLMISAWNVIDLQKVLARSTEEYLNDVTMYMAEEIGNTMKHKSRDLEMAADFIADEERAGLETILEQKAQIMEFNFLGVIDREGGMVHTPLPKTIDAAELEEIGKLDCVRDSFEGRDGTSYIGGQEIIYSVPVYRDSTVEYVMVGTRSKEKMQAMIASKSFDGESLSCIIDSSGKVILSPTDLKPFLQLGDIFKKSENREVVSELEEMLKDMQKGAGGILKFTSVHQEELFLSYDPLGVNDWVLLTIIPADLISGSLEGNIWRQHLKWSLLPFVLS